MRNNFGSVADEHYDFNYQQSRRVDPSLRIMPGDDVIVECDYDTEDRTNLTMVRWSPARRWNRKRRY